MKLTPYLIVLNENISLPIGMVLAVQQYSAKLNLVSIVLLAEVLNY